MKCPDCGNKMEVTLVDGDGTSEVVDHECEACGIIIEVQKKMIRLRPKGSIPCPMCIKEKEPISECLNCEGKGFISPPQEEEATKVPSPIPEEVPETLNTQ